MREKLVDNYLLVKNKINKLTFRERLLLLLVGAALIYILADFVFMDSLQQETIQNQSDNANLTIRTEGMLKELNNLENSLNNKMSDSEKNQYLKLQATLKETDLTLQKLTSDLMPVQKIPVLLAELLHDLAGLTLINVQTSESASMVSKEGLDHYKITLTLSGEYTQLLQYIQKVEAIPFFIRWKEMEYKVTKFPQAQIVLTLYVVLIPMGHPSHEESE